MDITKIDFDLIEHFSLSYSVAESVFDINPVIASADKQKEIRKWITKTHFTEEHYTQETEKYIGKNASDSEFLNFLKECNNYIAQVESKKKQAFDEACCDLSTDVKEAIWNLFEDDFLCSKIKKVGTDLQTKIYFGSGYTSILIFENASFDLDENYDFIYFSNATITKQNDNYTLTAEYEKDDEFSHFTITFTDARLDTTITKACETTFVNTPWWHLLVISNTIFSKHKLFPESINEAERELLPLLTEISTLFFQCNIISDELKTANYPILKSYFKNFGYDKLLVLLEKREKDTSEKNKYALKLFAKLNEKRYEPLWRKIYNLICESQKDYPPSTDGFCSEKSLSDIRNQIQTSLEAHGYFGTYPDFVKHDSIRSYRLAESYDMSYFIGSEKNVVYHIHCNEEFSDDHLNIEFLCGTQLLKKDEEPGDIYSCLFDSNGRSFYNTVLYFCNCADNGELEFERTNDFVRIAVKKAELQKLSKEERDLLGYPKYSSVNIFSTAFLLMGGLFAVFMTLGFMLIALLITAILVPEEIPSMFAEIPWYWIFALSWISFGGVMGVITTLAKRK